MKENSHYPVFMSSANKKATNQLMTVKNLTSKSADLYIYGEIVDNTDWKWDESEVMPDDVLNVLNQVEGLENLNIYINSPGGSVFAGLAIYNALKRNGAYKKAYIDGVGASMASVIPFAADEVFIPANAFLMVHNPWTFAIGNAEMLRKVADDLDNLTTGVMSIYMENTRDGVTEEVIKGLLDKESWLDGNEAAKFFNVTVIESKKYAASAKEYLSHYQKTPKNLLEPNESNQSNSIDIIKLQNELDLLTL